eukprot:1739354-Rhodomonas_salina.5
MCHVALCQDEQPTSRGPIPVPAACPTWTSNSEEPESTRGQSEPESRRGREPELEPEGGHRQARPGARARCFQVDPGHFGGWRCQCQWLEAAARRPRQGLLPPKGRRAHPPRPQICAGKCPSRGRGGFDREERKSGLGAECAIESARLHVLGRRREEEGTLTAALRRGT